MVWYIFAILGALLNATYFMLSKKSLEKIDQYVLASGVFLSSSIVLISIAIINGIPQIGPGFYYSVLATGVLNVIAATLYYRALKITDLSLSVPMISFTPLFLIFTSFIILGEFPTMHGMLGIFLIITGSYILNSTRVGGDLLDPFKNIFKNTGVFYMLIVAFLFSISANFDKLVVNNSDPYFGSSIVFSLIGGSFFMISIIKNRGIKVSYRKNFHMFFLIGLILALEAMAINIAFTMQIVPYVISLKRLSILFSVFYGSLIFFESGILQRSTGASIMVMGMVLIILY